jgi:hypothetical protein
MVDQAQGLTALVDKRFDLGFRLAEPRSTSGYMLSPAIGALSILSPVGYKGSSISRLELFRFSSPAKNPIPNRVKIATARHPWPTCESEPLRFELISTETPK